MKVCFVVRKEAKQKKPSDFLHVIINDRSKKSIFSTSTKIMRSVIFEHTIRKKSCAEKCGKIIIKNSFSVHKF